MKRPAKQAKASRAAQSAKALAPRPSNEAIDVGKLYVQVRAILDESRYRAARSVNVEMVRAYWLIGQAIVEHEQRGKERADYGARLVEALAERLAAEFRRGFDRSNLWHMRKFYLVFPDFLDAPRRELAWTHYRLLLKVEKPEARAFYEAEAAEGNWSTRQL